MGIWSKYNDMCREQQEANLKVLEERRKRRYQWTALGLGFLAFRAWTRRNDGVKIEVHES